MIHNMYNMSVNDERSQQCCVHIISFDASTITKALENFVASRQLDFRKLVGQGYDGQLFFQDV